MRFINKNTIKLDKVLNELDKFVIRLIKILEKHTDYVIISGYVATLLGRSRATDDIDIFIRESDKEQFLLFYNDLKKHGYWCLNGESGDELYQYLAEGLAIRFAIKKQITPNFEVKFAKKKQQLLAFSDTITVLLGENKIKISSLERQIAYKRYYLKSDKDLEDAMHIEKVFKEHIDINKVNYYKRIIENEMA